MIMNHGSMYYGIVVDLFSYVNVLSLSVSISLGVSLGWVCVYHQPYPSSRVCPPPDGKVLL